MGRKKYNFMTLLRVLSMLAIVLYHMVITLYIYGIRQYDSIKFLFENANMHIAKIGVGLFFILSGCGLMMSYENRELKLKEYFKKRFLKILIPFYIVYIIYVLFLMATGQVLLTNPYDGREVAPYSFIFTLLGMDTYLSDFGLKTLSMGIGEWFLGCLIFMYILFPVFRFFMKKNPYITMAASTVYYVWMILYYDSFSFISQVPMFTNLTIKIYDFILGMFLATVIKKFPGWIWIPGLAVNLFFVFCPVTLPGIDSYQIPIQCLSVFLIFFGLENVLSKKDNFLSGIEVMSAYSYECFLVHHIVINQISKVGINTDFGNTKILLLFLGESVVVILLTVVLKFLVKKVSSR